MRGVKVTRSTNLSKVKNAQGEASKLLKETDHICKYPSKREVCEQPGEGQLRVECRMHSIKEEKLL
jgi:hypothetical protein